MSQEFVDINQILGIEVDSTKDRREEESEKHKGFTPTGIKCVTYLSENLLQVQEAGVSTPFLMDFVTFEKIINVLGFKERSLELGLGKLLTGYPLIFDFTNKEIKVWDKDVPIKIMGEFIRKIKENYKRDENTF